MLNLQHFFKLWLSRNPTMLAVAVIRSFFLLSALVIGCVGMALPQVESKNSDAKFYLAHYKSGDTTTNYGDFSCGMYKERFTASLALGIVGLIFLAATLVFAVITIIIPSRSAVIPIVAGGVCNCLASVFLLTCWALTVAWYDGGAKYCGGAVPKDSDYKIANGLILIITSWCLLAVSGCCAAKATSD